MDLTVAELAYMAGIFDGEGTLGVSFKSGPTSRVRYDFNCSVANTDRALIDWMHERFGGKILPIKQQKSHHRPLWRVYWGVNESSDLMRVLLPYLLVKRDRAAMFLEIRALTGGTGARPTDEVRAKRDELASEFREMNRRGVGS